LIPPSTGLVLSTTARFHTTVSTTKQESPSQNAPFMTFAVKSPQFKTTFNYEMFLDAETQEIRLTTPNGNTFINLAILYSQLDWWKHQDALFGLHCDITIEADNDYYSQGTDRALTLNERQQLEPRKAPDVWPIQKTGLGSSAGLVTSLITGIRCALKAQIGEDTHSLDLERDIHRLAQFVHALAQGKVGSGFDVCAAVYGSQKYERFPVSALQRIMDKVTSQSMSCTKQLKEELHGMLHNDTQWVYVRTPFALPHGFNLFVADVKGGSETPGMVRRVLQWKKEHKNAPFLWRKIDKLNQQVDQYFVDIENLHEKNAELYESTLERLSQAPVAKWNCLDEDKILVNLRDTMLELRCCFVEIRKCMKQMGDESGVEIEPDLQTELSDATMATNGCLVAGVPGAGGYDAIFSIIFGCESRSNVEKEWKVQSEKMQRVISPLLLEESKRVGLKIKEE